MKHFNFIIILSFVMLFFTQSVDAHFWPFNKKKSKTEQQDSVKKVTKYDKTFSKEDGCLSVVGAFATLHKKAGKIYMELDQEYLGRELLIAATVTGTSDSDVATMGYKARSPLHCRFVRRDSTIYLERINVLPDVNRADSSRMKSIVRVHQNPVLSAFEIFCMNNDNTKSVFEVTDLLGDAIAELSPLGRSTSIGLSIKAKYDEKKSSVDQIKAFEDNVSVKSTMSYSVTTTFWGLLTILRDAPVSLDVTHTILLLPEEKMQARLADSRIGIFPTNRKTMEANADKIVTYSVINRWNLIYKDTTVLERGELSEPVKPIVFYLDNAFPELWGRAAKAGVLRWNKAFEEIGFKNAIVVKDFPINDSIFDPDNLKYSCIRYIPTAIPNAMGPSWVDPTSGEIINASVIIYNDVAKLVNNWRFTQTAQVDERVRSVKMPDDVMFESMEYVVAHEAGHCLGFMHNMSGSAAYPVDSLRSKSFTAKYGTTSSIMDYARYNYVAQPEDKGVKLSPPTLGLYDYHLVKYAYQPITTVKGTESERDTLYSWIEQKENDSIYRYGRQQVSLRCDPTSIEEDLGDDAIKASNYGVKNLKYILSNLDEWIADTDDPDYQHRINLYNSIVKQYNRYIQAVLMNIGGIKLYDARNRSRTVAVDREYQQEAAKWILGQIRDCQWLAKREISERSPLTINIASDFADNTVSDLFRRVSATALSSHIATDGGYKPQEFIKDIYNDVWAPTIANKTLSMTDRILQREFVSQCISTVVKDKKSSGSSLAITDLDAYRPTLNQMSTYGFELFGIDPTMDQTLAELQQMNDQYDITEQMFGKPGYNWQKRVSASVVDETPMVWYYMATQCKQLLVRGVRMSKGETKLHYQTLLQRMEWLLSDN